MRYMLLILLILLAAEAHATAIGVNRADIRFDDVLRGGYARGSVTVTTDSEEMISGELILYGEEQEWLNFSDRFFNFSRNQPYTLYVDVQPPLDARIDNYRVNMSILTGELSRSEGGLLGTTTRASLGVPIFISMTGNEKLSCRVGGVQVRDTERGQELEVVLSILNTGNVRISPEVNIEIHDKLQSDLLETEPGDYDGTIFPTITGEGSIFYSISLPRDQYWVTVNVPLCSYSGFFTFDVLEAGEVKDEGEFIRIDAPPWSEVGDIISIKAIFRNLGVRSVRASFRGTISRIDNEQIVKVINTDEYTVDPSATAEIETFFNPEDPGQYMVTGKIFYNQKLTTEKSFVLNVNGSSIAGGSAKGFWLIGIIIVILVLLILIKRKKSGPQIHHRIIRR